MVKVVVVVEEAEVAVVIVAVAVVVLSTGIAPPARRMSFIWSLCSDLKSNP